MCVHPKSGQLYLALTLMGMRLHSVIYVFRPKCVHVHKNTFFQLALILTSLWPHVFSFSLLYRKKLLTGPGIC